MSPRGFEPRSAGPWPDNTVICRLEAGRTIQTILRAQCSFRILCDLKGFWLEKGKISSSKSFFPISDIAQF